jgi:hypothetical protein
MLQMSTSPRIRVPRLEAFRAVSEEDLLWYTKFLDHFKNDPNIDKSVLDKVVRRGHPYRVPIILPAEVERIQKLVGQEPNHDDLKELEGKIRQGLPDTHLNPMVLKTEHIDVVKNSSKKYDRALRIGRSHTVSIERYAGKTVTAEHYGLGDADLSDIWARDMSMHGLGLAASRSRETEEFIYMAQDVCENQDFFEPVNIEALTLRVTD